MVQILIQGLPATHGPVYALSAVVRLQGLPVPLLHRLGHPLLWKPTSPEEITQSMERDDIEACNRRNGDTVSKEKLMTATEVTKFHAQKRGVWISKQKKQLLSKLESIRQASSYCTAGNRIHVTH